MEIDILPYWHLKVGIRETSISLKALGIHTFLPTGNLDWHLSEGNWGGVGGHYSRQIFDNGIKDTGIWQTGI
jgi:hypothetical protein